MSRFDRYMLSQLLLFFSFFALVLVAVFWINRSVRLFDRLIGDGQTAGVFFEFTLLSLPGLILLVLPLASFAAAIYVTNRLMVESELTVMLSTGSSPWRLARPVFVFGLLVALMMSVLAHLLVPMAVERLNFRETEISQDVTARIFTAGTFLHPSDGVTLYTREIREDGVLQDVFLFDQRSPDTRVIYTAKEAYLVQRDDESSLIMVDGLSQRLTLADQRLVTGVFEDFSYDISNLVLDATPVGDMVKGLTSEKFLVDWHNISALSQRSFGHIAEELHARFAQPLVALVAALIGFSAILASGYSRFGAWREIVVAFTLLIVLDGLRAAMTDVVRGDVALWWAMYVPPALGGSIALMVLWTSARPLRRARREVTV